MLHCFIIILVHPWLNFCCSVRYHLMLHSVGQSSWRKNGVFLLFTSQFSRHKSFFQNCNILPHCITKFCATCWCVISPQMKDLLLKLDLEGWISAGSVPEITFAHYSSTWFYPLHPVRWHLYSMFYIVSGLIFFLSPVILI